MGKGPTWIRSSQRKLVPDMSGWIMQANLTERNSKVSKMKSEIMEASITEEPRAVVPHAGICAGAVG